MRKEYDLKKMKVKRRGILPELHGTSPAKIKFRLNSTISDPRIILPRP